MWMRKEKGIHVFKQQKIGFCSLQKLHRVLLFHLDRYQQPMDQWDLVVPSPVHVSKKSEMGFLCIYSICWGLILNRGFIGVSESHHSCCFRLFRPKILGGGGDLWMLFCHSMTTGWVMGTLRGGGDSSCNRKKLNILHSQVVGMQKHLPSACSSPSHLVKLSQFFKIKLRSFRRLWQKNQVFIQETTTNNSSNCV